MSSIMASRKAKKEHCRCNVCLENVDGKYKVGQNSYRSSIEVFDGGAGHV